MGAIVNTITVPADQGGRHACWVPDDIYHYPLICYPDNVMAILTPDSDPQHPTVLYEETALKGSAFQVLTIEAKVSAFHEPGQLPHVILLCGGFDVDTNDARATIVATTFGVRPERYPTEGV